MKRKGVSASLRWQVFARDGFRCRYCGAQAGEAGVTLHADHVVSVADGGTNAMDNLVTACQRCNGGKGARSMSEAPGSVEAIDRANQRAATLRQQADAIGELIEAREEARQEVINLICEAYDRKSFPASDQVINQFTNLLQRHGAEQLFDWISQAAGRGVALGQCLRYVHGIIRTIRNESGGTNP